MAPTDQDDIYSLHWAVPLNEPDAAPRPTARPQQVAADNSESPAILNAVESFLLLGEDPPGDEVFRPRLGRFEDAA